MTSVATPVRRKHPAAECELWEGTVSSHGYGTIGGGYNKKYIHRVVWEKEHGPIPVGYEVHHTCGNRLCVNILHLQLLTISEHHSLRYDVCRNGHRRTPDNIKVINTTKGPPRHECRQCRKDRGLKS